MFLAAVLTVLSILCAAPRCPGVVLPGWWTSVPRTRTGRWLALTRRCAAGQGGVRASLLSHDALPSFPCSCPLWCFHSL